MFNVCWDPVILAKLMNHKLLDHWRKGTDPHHHHHHDKHHRHHHGRHRGSADDLDDSRISSTRDSALSAHDRPSRSSARSSIIRASSTGRLPVMPTIADSGNDSDPEAGTIAFPSGPPQTTVDLERRSVEHIQTTTQEMFGVQQQAQRKEEQEDGQWKRFSLAAHQFRWMNQMNSYSEEFSKFVQKHCHAKLSRLEVLFDGENPQRFIDRVKTAVEMRKRSEQLIRYNLAIDKMPDTAIEGLTTFTLDKIKARVDSSGVSANELGTAYGELESEIKTDYVRTLNKLVFDTLQEGERRAYGCYNFTFDLPKQDIQMWNRWSGPIDNPGYDFDFHEVFKSFCAASLLTEAGGPFAILQVQYASVAMCDTVELWDVWMDEALPLSDFTRHQENHIEWSSSRVKNVWVDDIARVLKEELTLMKGYSVGLNVDRHTFSHGKFCRMLTRCDLIMEDALQKMLCQSAQTFVDVLTTYVPNSVEIIDCKTVRSIYDANKSPEELKREDDSSYPKALFKLTVQRDAGFSEFQYSTSDSEVLKIVLEIFDAGVSSIQTVRRVSNRLAPGFFLTNWLGALHTNSLELQPYKQQIAKLFEDAFPDLRRYLATLEDYKSDLPLLTQDLPLEQEEYSFEQLKEMTLDHKRIADTFRAWPSSVYIGMFEIIIEEIKTSFTDLHERFVRQIQDHIRSRITALTSEGEKVRNEIIKDLTYVAPDIESLVDQEDR